MSGDALVRIAGVQKHFSRGGERIEVLKGVNLDIPPGDFLALMGPSGSGKTTLLNLMGGLDTPSGGSVDVNGVRINELSGARLSKWRSQPSCSHGRHGSGFCTIQTLPRRCTRPAGAHGRSNPPTGHGPIRRGLVAP